jgi:RimJ/RimL family protein N-acetyltransferase
MTSAPTIRQADAQQAWEFLRYVQDQITGPNPIFELGDVQFIAELDGTIVGIITLSNRDRWNKGYAEVRTVFVRREYERQSIATRLCEEAVKHFVQLGKTPIICNAINERLHDVLNKLPLDLIQHVNIMPSYLIYGNFDVYQTRRNLE